MPSETLAAIEPVPVGAIPVEAIPVEAIPVEAMAAGARVLREIAAFDAAGATGRT